MWWWCVQVFKFIGFINSIVLNLSEQSGNRSFFLLFALSCTARFVGLIKNLLSTDPSKEEH